MNRFTKSFEEADKSFKRENQEAIGKLFDKLKGLSGEEFAKLIPDVEKRSELIKIVEDAKDRNLSQAELLENISKLGTVTVDVCKKLFGL